MVSQVEPLNSSRLKSPRGAQLECEDATERGAPISGAKEAIRVNQLITVGMIGEERICASLFANACQKPPTCQLKTNRSRIDSLIC